MLGLFKWKSLDGFDWEIRSVAPVFEGGLIDDGSADLIDQLSHNPTCQPIQVNLIRSLSTKLEQLCGQGSLLFYRTVIENGSLATLPRRHGYLALSHFCTQEAPNTAERSSMPKYASTSVATIFEQEIYPSLLSM